MTAPAASGRRASEVEVARAIRAAFAFGGMECD